ncbi:MAG: hypothetical protein GX801_10365, partial [Fibrobacter sp.]|nr:hypothetical protein [Fibrobacter sp.]
DLVAILLQLIKYKKILFLLTLSGGVLGVLLALHIPPKYKSVSKIIYQTSSKSNSNMTALASLTGINIGGNAGEDPSAYLDEVLKSGFFTDLLLKKKWRVSILELDTSNTYQLFEIWGMEPDTSIINWQYKFDEAQRMKLLKGEYIRYNQNKKNGVISLVTEFEDPLLSYNINVFLFEHLNEFLVNKINLKAKKNKEFVADRLREAELKLTRSENVLKNYLEKNRMRITPEATLEESRLQRRVMINQEVTTQLQKQFEMAKIEEAKDLPLLELIDAPRLAIDKSKPQRKQIVLIALTIGLFVGCTIAFLIEAIRTRV